MERRYVFWRTGTGCLLALLALPVGAALAAAGVVALISIRSWLGWVVAGLAWLLGLTVNGASFFVDSQSHRKRSAGWLREAAVCRLMNPNPLRRSG